MKRFSMMIASAALAGVSSLGIGYSRVSLMGLRSTMQHAIDDLKPDDQRIAEAAIRIQEREQQVATFAADEKAAENRLTAAKTELAKLKTQAEDEREILERSRHLLEDRQEMYEIAGRTYSQAELSRDSVQRVADYNSLKQTIAAKEVAVSQLSAAVSNGQQVLAQARTAVAVAQENLKDLQIRLSGAKLTAATEAQLHLDNGAADDDPLARLGHDVDKAEALAHTAVPSNGVVDWKAHTDTAVNSISDALR